MTNVYYGSDHIFTSRKGNTIVTLKAGVGETLLIEGYTPNSSSAAGIDTSVQYNDNGDLGSSDTFTYDGTNLLVPNLSTDNIYGSILTNDIGHNEIYRGTGPQQVITAYTSVPYPASSMGADVTMARDINYAAINCTSVDEFDDFSGISIWKESVGTFSEYSSLLSVVYVTSTSLKFSAINDDATLAGISDGIGSSARISIWKRVGSTWSFIYDIDGQIACKISGNNLICYDRFFNISVYDRFEDTFNHNQYLSENFYTENSDPNIQIEIQGNRYVFMVLGIIEIWDYTDEFGFNRSYLAGSSALTFAYSNGVLVTLTTSRVKIYENFVLTNQVNLSNPLYVTTNGTYIFVISSTGVITILHKSAGVWIVSFNTTTLSTGKKMSCNANYLVVGEPTFGTSGRASIYRIVVYNNEPGIYNTIDMLGSGNKLIITAPAGVKLSNNLILPNGTEAEPSINFAATGMYSSVPTNIDFVTAATKRILVTSGGLIKITNTTDPTSVTTGSLQTLGGIGVSKTIFATTYSSPNGAFKLSSYEATTAQSCSATVTVPVLFGTDLLTGITTLTKSASGGGSRYTTSIACKLLICWSLRSTGTSNFGQTLLLIGGSGKFYGHCNAWAQAGQGNALSSSAILDLSVSDYFSVFVIFDATCNISNDATYQISMLQIYSLN